jgi:hypothetical protein
METASPWRSFQAGPAAYITVLRRDWAEGGSRRKFLRRHFGLFLSNLDWQGTSYNLSFPVVCDGEYIGL